MVYTKQEKQEIERVLAVFAKYLNQRNHCDIAWSNKLGYLLLDYHTCIDDVTAYRHGSRSLQGDAGLYDDRFGYEVKIGTPLKGNRRRGKSGDPAFVATIF